jgi:hypothetical protein
MVLLAVLFILPQTGSQIIYDASFRPVITLKKTCKWPAEMPQELALIAEKLTFDYVQKQRKL